MSCRVHCTLQHVGSTWLLLHSISMAVPDQRTMSITKERRRSHLHSHCNMYKQVTAPAACSTKSQPLQHITHINSEWPCLNVCKPTLPLQQQAVLPDIAHSVRSMFAGLPAFLRDSCECDVPLSAQIPNSVDVNCLPAACAA